MRKGLLVALLALGCGSEASGPTARELVCEPGKSEACACPGGTSGAQVCEEDGASWGACECGVDVPDGGTIAYDPDDYCRPSEPWAHCLDTSRRSYSDCAAPDAGELAGCTKIDSNAWCC